MLLQWGTLLEEMNGPEVSVALHSNIKYLRGGIVVRIAQVRNRFLLLQLDHVAQRKHCITLVGEKYPDPLVRCLYPNFHVNGCEIGVRVLLKMVLLI